MKIKYLFILQLVVSLTACYRDKGNYDYREINEVAISGIEDSYARDIDDNLMIEPSIEGTQYSDLSRFSYAWKFDDRVVSEEFALDYIVNLTPGMRRGRFEITDRETGVVTNRDFALNVSSSTAGDLFMILSKSRGKAEMSYMRLDREDANFAVNYFEERFGRPLGADPQQLEVFYMDARYDREPYVRPFGHTYGGLFVLVDNQVNLWDKNSLEPEEDTPMLNEQIYIGEAVYLPDADVDGYSSQFIHSQIEGWITIASGDRQTGVVFHEISDGKVYGYQYRSNVGLGGSSFSIAHESPYEGGYLAPIGFYSGAAPTSNARYPVDMGYDVLGTEFMIYDMVNYRFASKLSYGQLPVAIKTTDLPAFEGFVPIYGSHTNEPTLCFAVMQNGATFEIVVLRRESPSVFKLAGRVNVSSIVTGNSKFYTMTRSPYVLIATDDKVYSYNLLDALGGVTPSPSPIITLDDCGYGAEARITAIFVSRTERTMLLGVSRYGSDTEAMSEENKGDLVVLDLNREQLTLEYDHKYEGVAGIPVDVKIKYQTHYRYGEDYVTKEVIDNY